jgi:2-oxoglutarate dehydrogenase E2 component (dihydrolipoamide succinyltransferase)
MQEIDMSALLAWRERNKSAVLKATGIRLGFMRAFIKAASLASQKVPTINSSMDLEVEDVIYKDFVDISIAVSTPKGLVTPVLRDCHEMNILQIEEQVAAMAKKVLR